MPSRARRRTRTPRRPRRERDRAAPRRVARDRRVGLAAPSGAWSSTSVTAPTAEHARIGTPGWPARKCAVPRAARAARYRRSARRARWRLRDGRAPCSRARGRGSGARPSRVKPAGRRRAGRGSGSRKAKTIVTCRSSTSPPRRELLRRDPRRRVQPLLSRLGEGGRAARPAAAHGASALSRRVEPRAAAAASSSGRRGLGGAGGALVMGATRAGALDRRGRRRQRRGRVRSARSRAASASSAAGSSPPAGAERHARGRAGRRDKPAASGRNASRRRMATRTRSTSSSARTEVSPEPLRAQCATWNGWPAFERRARQAIITSEWRRIGLASRIAASSRCRKRRPGSRPSS